MSPHQSSRFCAVTVRHRTRLRIDSREEGTSLCCRQPFDAMHFTQPVAPEKASPGVQAAFLITSTY